MTHQQLASLHINLNSMVHCLCCLPDSQIWAVDKTGTLAIFSVRTGFLLATKSLSDQPIVKIMAVSGK